MLYSTTLLVAVAALTSVVSAQNSSLPTCCTVPVSQVPSSLKSSWCQAETNTCPEICGSLSSIATNGNTCNSDTLEYTCKCKNGTSPDMSQYQQSVPGLMCREWFDACINATGDSRELQFQCTTQRDSKCGNLTTDSATASSSASASGTATKTSGGSTASSTGARSSASAGAATALAMVRDYSTPMLAGGIAALFGLAL